MGWILKDFNCSICGVHEKMVQFNTTEIVCCGRTATSLISAPLVVGADSFNAHFDLTQGQYFSSPEHKQNWLKSKDKEQLEGNLSPRTSGHGRVICSQDQAKKFRSSRAREIKNSDLPLNTTGRTSFPITSSDN